MNAKKADKIAVGFLYGIAFDYCIVFCLVLLALFFGVVFRNFSGILTNKHLNLSSQAAGIGIQ